MTTTERAAAPGGAGEASERARQLVDALTMACGQGEVGMLRPDRHRNRLALLAYIAGLERRAGAGAGERGEA